MRTPHTLCALLAGALSLTGCASAKWPDAVGGGMAEFAPPAQPPAMMQTATAHHLTCSLTTLRQAAAAAAQTGRQTGRIAVLQEQAARATREFHGNLTDDAERTLTALDQALAALPLRASAFAMATPEHCIA